MLLIFIEEVRIRYVQSSSRLEQIYAHLRDLVSSGVSSAEETLGQVLEILSGIEKKAEGKGKKVAADSEGLAKEKKYAAEKKTAAAKETIQKKKNEL